MPVWTVGQADSALNEAGRQAHERSGLLAQPQAESLTQSGLGLQRICDLNRLHADEECQIKLLRAEIEGLRRQLPGKRRLRGEALCVGFRFGGRRDTTIPDSGLLCRHRRRAL